MVSCICLLLLSDNSSELFSADEMSQETSDSDLKYTVLGVELQELELGASGDLDKVLDPINSRSSDFFWKSKRTNKKKSLRLAYIKEMPSNTRNCKLIQSKQQGSRFS